MIKKHIWKVMFVVLSLMLVAGCSSTSGSSSSDTKDKQKSDTVTIYVTRHGKTMLNTTDRVQGWADTPLTEPGVEVADDLGKGLKAEGIKFDAAYSSDLGRAKETAEHVLDAAGQKKLPIQESEKLREVCFGKYEGDLNANMWGDIAKGLGYSSQDDMMKDFSTGKVTIDQAVDEIVKLDDMGMAESYATVKDRMQSELKTIAEKAAKAGDENVLVVSHGMSIGAMLSDMTDKYKGQQLENASVTKILYKDGKFDVQTIGDMSYVEKGEKE
ncbi:histidine phosphatase family protein [Listeria costaricensis]|uniref:histidine phosphatase family protein n=1 Tax=Listeria costaricensis TaxID=2026604 RepID=UPI00308452AD